MSKKLCAAVAALAAVAFAPAANATVVEGIQLPAGDYFDHFEGESTTSGSGQFDAFSFTIAEDSIANILLTSTANATNDLDFEAVDIDGIYSFSLSNGFFSSASFTGASLAAGSHTLNVKYKSTTSKVTYAGDISLAPVPVPAPASWAVMLAGIGGLGMVMRRRVAVARIAYA